MSFAHYRTVPKYKMTPILKNNMAICTHHFLGAFYGFMRLFSVLPSHLYDFIFLPEAEKK
jgi:hypothetical protein